MESILSSKEFKKFGKHEGFEHHKITPLHSRTNSEAERFMQILINRERIAYLEGKNPYERQNPIQDMLAAYRSTPHQTKGVAAPYDATRRGITKTKLNYVETTEGKQKVTTKSEELFVVVNIQHIFIFLLLLFYFHLPTIIFSETFHLFRSVLHFGFQPLPQRFFFDFRYIFSSFCCYTFNIFILLS